MGDATARLSRPFRPAGVGLRRKRTFDQRLGDFAGEAALGVFESAMATTMGLTKIAQAIRESAQAGKRSGSKGGSSDDRRSWDRDDHSRTGRNDGDWSKTGRSGW